MGRPMGGTNEYHTKEEKLSLVKRNLEGETIASIEKETRVNSSQIAKWVRQYIEDGEERLENKKKPGNPLVKYQRKKELTQTEELEYKVAKLERELLKKDAQIYKLKKSLELEGVDIKKL